MDEQLQVEVRPGEPADLALVYATWLRSVRHSSLFSRGVSNRVFFAAHHLVIERLLGRGAQLLVAHPPGEPGVILGYLCYERVAPGMTIAGLELAPHVVHFIYTKGAFRRLGVARTLLDVAGVDLNRSIVTHLTSDAAEQMKRFPGAEYWPYLLA